jgi:zinc transport system substrate-binding protein
MNRVWILYCALLSFLLSALPVLAAPRVAISIAPIHALVAEVMAGAGEPVLLVEAGADPHHFALRPSQAAAVSQAQVVIWVGARFEGHLGKAVKTLAPHAELVTLLDRPELTRLPQRSYGERQKGAPAGPLDPHVWLDPVNAAAIVELTAAVLSGRDPENAGTYARNAADVAARLRQLDATLSTRLQPVRQQPFVVVHDAFQYLEARYDLNNLGAIKGAGTEGRQVGLIRYLNQRAAAENASCVFAEQQFDGGASHGLDTPQDMTLVVLDPMGYGLPMGPGLYDAMMLRLIDGIIACLGR